MASAQDPGLHLTDAELLLPGQHLIVEGRTGVAPPAVQVSIQPQPKAATKERRVLAPSLQHPSDLPQQPLATP